MQNIPAFGQFYLISSVSISLLVFTTSLNPYDISYTFKSTVFELSFWRPLTAILYLGRFGLLLPVHLVFAYIAFRYGVIKMYGQERKADLVWLFILSMLSLSIFSTFTSLYFFGSSFIMILLVMWGVQYSNDQLIIANVRIPSVFVPMAYAIVMIMLGSTFKNYMAGFLIGLLLGVVKDRKFMEKHGEMLATPLIIRNYFMAEAVSQPEEPVRMPIVQNPRYQLNPSPDNKPNHQPFSGHGHRIG